MGSFTPIDVTFGTDGALYIMEWESATIYRVTYAATDDDSNARSGISLGETIFRNGVAGAPACIGCHTLSGFDTATAPSLIRLVERAESRDHDLSIDEYIRESILDPDAYVVSGYGAGLMYQSYAEMLTTEQVDALVAFVLSL